ncbi:MAG: hypothetical protein ACPGRZ_09295 [Alphaproteobacteria bacterium]
MVNRILPLAGLATAISLFADPGICATFRQVPDLPAVPPAIDHPAEREMLVRDLEQLATRRDRVIVLRKDFASQCGDRPPGRVLSRTCQFRQVEIRRETSRLRTDLLALRDRMRRIEEGVQRRRLEDGQPARAARSVAPDRRFEIVRDALSGAGETWQDVLDPLIQKAAREAGDPAFRDAAAYLGGIYQGHLAAMRLNDPFYKHGVRRVLAGDDWSATIAFAQAARDHRDDPLIFAAYAAAAGRQHASPACARAGRCVRGNLADWAGGFGKQHRRIAQRLEKHVSETAAAPQTRAAVRVLMAVSVYAGRAPALTDGVAAIPAKPGSQAFPRIALAYLKAWAAADAARARMFARRYDAAGQPNRVVSLLGYEDTAPRRLSNSYLAKLRDAFANPGDQNPFAGALDRQQLIRLQK